MRSRKSSNYTQTDLQDEARERRILFLHPMHRDRRAENLSNYHPFIFANHTSPLLQILHFSWFIKLRQLEHRLRNPLSTNSVSTESFAQPAAAKNQRTRISLAYRLLSYVRSTSSSRRRRRRPIVLGFFHRTRLISKEIPLVNPKVFNIAMTRLRVYVSFRFPGVHWDRYIKNEVKWKEKNPWGSSALRCLTMWYLSLRLCAFSDGNSNYSLIARFLNHRWSESESLFRLMLSAQPLLR